MENSTTEKNLTVVDEPSPARCKNCKSYPCLGGEYVTITYFVKDAVIEEIQIGTTGKRHYRYGVLTRHEEQQLLRFIPIMKCLPAIKKATID